MAGGLTAASNQMFSTLESIPGAIQGGLQAGTRIRLANQEGQISQQASDFRTLKNLAEINSPKLKKLLRDDPEQAKVFIEKIKAANSELVGRMGLETFTAGLDKKGKVQYSFLQEVNDSVREQIKTNTGQDSNLKDGEMVKVTSDGENLAFESVGSSSKDFSATNITTLFKTILSSQAWGEEDSDKAWKDTLKIIRTVNPNSDWLKPGALADVKDNSVGAPEDRLPPEEAKEKISLFTKLFRRFNDPNKAVAKAIPKQPKKIKPVSFDSFRDNPVKGVPVEFPNGQTKVWKGGSFSLRDSWKDG